MFSYMQFHLFLTSSLGRSIIKGVKSSGYGAEILSPEILSPPLSSYGNGNLLGLFMGPFPNVKYNKLGPTPQD